MDNRPSFSISGSLTRPLVRWGRSHIRRLRQSYGNLSIEKKLNFSFGILVAMTFLVVATIFIGGVVVSRQVTQTQQQHFPAALTSAQAQANLLRMMSNVRGYLATAESEFRHQYQESRQNFEVDLTEMDRLMRQSQTAPEVLAELDALEALYQDWLLLPETLFTLRDDTIANQPALKLLQEEGEALIATVLSHADRLIQLQSERSPTAENITTLESLFAFKSAFALSVAALRSFLVTQNDTFRFEYADSAEVAATAWQTLLATVPRLTPEQNDLFVQMQQAYARCRQLPLRLFAILDEGVYRQDLNIFQTQAEPLAREILVHLDQLVERERLSLSQQMARSRAWLAITQWQTLIGGGISLVLAIALAFLLRRDIAGPIHRLTIATARIIEGDYDVQARVESKDEIGTLAETFNRMARFLKRSRTDLEDYNRKLESQVAQRTQELQEKNDQLLTALADLQRTQSQLVQTEKMSSLGQLVAGVAHEINNPVNFIYGNVVHASNYTRDLLELVQKYQAKYPHPDPDIQDHIEAIDLDFVMEDMPQLIASMRMGASRIQEIVASLRTFSRMDEAELKAVDLHDGLESTLMILHNRLKANQTRSAIVIHKYYGRLPLVECYPGQLNQVFMNILSNAIDALDSWTDHPSDFQPAITIATYRSENNTVVIKFEDNGPGISSENLQRLFDPFYTTKPVGKGTGLGLSISYQIITERHRGELSCQSEVGNGATFRIQIPVSQEK